MVMSQGKTLGVLLAISAVGLTIGYLALRHLQVATQAIADCAPSVPLDTSAIWLLGCGAIALLPLIAVVPAKLHAPIFALLVAAFFLLPGLAHGWVTSTAQTAGYTGTPPLFSLQSATLTSTATCQSQPTAVA